MKLTKFTWQPEEPTEISRDDYHALKEIIEEITSELEAGQTVTLRVRGQLTEIRREEGQLTLKKI